MTARFQKPAREAPRPSPVGFILVPWELAISILTYNIQRKGWWCAVLCARRQRRGCEYPALGPVCLESCWQDWCGCFLSRWGPPLLPTWQSSWFSCRARCASRKRAGLPSQQPGGPCVSARAHIPTERRPARVCPGFKCSCWLLSRATQLPGTSPGSSKGSGLWDLQAYTSVQWPSIPGLQAVACSPAQLWVSMRGPVPPRAVCFVCGCS